MFFHDSQKYNFFCMVYQYNIMLGCINILYLQIICFHFDYKVLKVLSINLTGGNGLRGSYSLFVYRYQRYQFMELESKNRFVLLLYWYTLTNIWWIKLKNQHILSIVWEENKRNHRNGSNIVDKTTELRLNNVWQRYHWCEQCCLLSQSWLLKIHLYSVT